MTEPTVSTAVETETTVSRTTERVPGPPVAPGPQRERRASLASDAWRELKHNPIFWVSAVLILIFGMMALFPQLFTSTDPYANNACSLSNSLEPPSSQHWMGTDVQGCDQYARVIYSARASVSVGIIVTLLTTLIGGIVGAAAGFYGGTADAVLSRITDIFAGLPLLLGGVVFLSVFKFKGIWGVVLALSVLGWITAARIMRSSVIQVKNADYVQAARALGANNARVMRRHVLPNALTPVIVIAMLSLGGYVSTEATLSFLGIGLQPPTISWGVMISDASKRFLTAPYLLLFPSLFLSLTVLSFILLGEAVRDALDPKLR